MDERRKAVDVLEQRMRHHRIHRAPIVGEDEIVGLHRLGEPLQATGERHALQAGKIRLHHRVDALRDAVGAPSRSGSAETMVCLAFAPKALISWTLRNSLPPAAKVECRCRMRGRTALMPRAQQCVDGRACLRLVECRRMADLRNGDGFASRMPLLHPAKRSCDRRGDTSPRTSSTGLPFERLESNGHRSGGTAASSAARIGSAIFMS